MGLLQDFICSILLSRVWRKIGGKKYNYNRMITKSIVLVNFKINRVRNSLPRKMYKALQNY